MSYEIKETCVCCGACAMDCPVFCIRREDGQFHIDLVKCIGCGDCYAICPVGAIVPIHTQSQLLRSQDE